MIHFILFALYLCFGTFLLVVWPVMLHPTLSWTRKVLVILLSFVVLVAGALALYLWLGVPQLAAH